MKLIIARSILREDTEFLPEDFIDLENKVITWHSDSEYDNVLKIKYNGRFINVSLIKDEKVPERDSNMIRIRTSGSEYGTYHQEFSKFFRNLCALQRSLNPEDYGSNLSDDSAPQVHSRKNSFMKFTLRNLNK